MEMAVPKVVVAAKHIPGGIKAGKGAVVIAPIQNDLSPCHQKVEGRGDAQRIEYGSVGIDADMA